MNIYLLFATCARWPAKRGKRLRKASKRRQNTDFHATSVTSARRVGLSRMINRANWSNSQLTVLNFRVTSASSSSAPLFWVSHFNSQIFFTSSRASRICQSRSRLGLAEKLRFLSTSSLTHVSANRRSRLAMTAHDGRYFLRKKLALPCGCLHMCVRCAPSVLWLIDTFFIIFNIFLFPFLFWLCASVARGRRSDR